MLFLERETPTWPVPLMVRAGYVTSRLPASRILIPVQTQSEDDNPSGQDWPGVWCVPRVGTVTGVILYRRYGNGKVSQVLTIGSTFPFTDGTSSDQPFLIHFQTMLLLPL